MYLCHQPVTAKNEGYSCQPLNSGVILDKRVLLYVSPNSLWHLFSPFTLAMLVSNTSMLVLDAQGNEKKYDIF